MEHAGAACEPTPRLRSSTSLAALTLFALLAPCHLRREGRAAHRAQSTSSIVPIRRPELRPAASAGGDASVCHGTSRSLPHVRRRDHRGVCFGRSTPHHNHYPTTRTHHPQPVPLTTLHATNQVERALLLHPTLLHGYSVRPIFLGCCALAVKMTCELHTSLSHLHSRVKDVFNLLELELLARIEHQLLEVLGSQPALVASQRLALAPLPPSLRPNACAGAGLAGAHGERALSAVRRRDLPRGSGRAPGAARHHAGPTDPSAVGRTSGRT